MLPQPPNHVRTVEAGLELALLIAKGRDGIPLDTHALIGTAHQVLRAAHGDPIDALISLASLISVDGQVLHWPAANVTPITERPALRSI
ncbi:MAG TPA: hypothetical protein VGH54_21440 [Mycobacterium sp.]|jgi:hypothetical protein|uniref:hypothetical protein n=1 Tax=Mycobacterium sp. TaxID=1785 RepID=UPI002F3F2A21